MAGAAALIGAGGADLALIDPAAAASVPDFTAKARAILAPRQGDEYGRVEMVAVTTAASPRKTHADLAGARVVLGGNHRVAAEGPFRALADWGVQRETLGAVTQAGDPDLAVKALREGKADVMLLHVSAWFRMCRPTRPGEKRCADLHEAFRARPRAKLAWAAPLSMDETLRYRLIGIHIALHLDAPAAYAWVAAQAPNAQSIDPTEAGALTIAR
jgi:ABC-type phosphate/phosphonate transport system substrate-binding protein